MASEEIKKQILDLAKIYYQETFCNEGKFTDGDRVDYAGRVFDESEIVNLIDSSLEFWLTAGRYTTEFETKFSE